MSARAAAVSAVSGLLVGLLLVGIAERGLGAPAAPATPQPRTKPAADPIADDDPFGTGNKPAVARPFDPNPFGDENKPAAAKAASPNGGTRKLPAADEFGEPVKAATKDDDPFKAAAKDDTTANLPQLHKPKPAPSASGQMIQLVEPAKNPPAAGAAHAAASAPLSEEAICKVLAERVTIDLKETPFDDFVERLSQISGTNIILDTQALEECDIQSDTPVTISVKNLTMHSALNLVLRKIDPSPTKPVLTWSVGDGVVTITTKEAADQHLSTKVYAVGDLVGPHVPGIRVQYADGGAPAHSHEFDDLITLIQDIDSDSWKQNGGPADVGEAGQQTLVVAQRWDIHGEIAALFDTLRAARAAQEKHPGGEPRWLANARPAESDGAARIRRAMERPVKMDFEETPLDDIVDYLKDATGLPIEIDTSALEEVDVQTDAPVTILVKNVPLRKALELLLHKVEPSPTKPVLTWSIEDEVLTITTKEAAEHRLAFVAYPVLDLTKPAAGGPRPIAPDLLMEVLKKNIDPDSWQDSGGPAVARYIDTCGVLVVAQTDAAQTEIEKLLGELRRVRQGQAAAGRSEPDPIEVVTYQLRMAPRQTAPPREQAPAGPSPVAALVLTPAPAPAATPGPAPPGVVQVPGSAPVAPGGVVPQLGGGGIGAAGGGLGVGGVGGGIGSSGVQGPGTGEAAELTPRDADELKAMIVEQVGVDQWPAGKTSVHRIGDRLIVRQKESAQRKIHQFLKDLDVLILDPSIPRGGMGGDILPNDFQGGGFGGGGFGGGGIGIGGFGVLNKDDPLKGFGTGGAQEGFPQAGRGTNKEDPKDTHH